MWNNWYNSSKKACDVAVSLISGVIQENNEATIKESEKRVANYFYKHATPIAGDICRAVNKKINESKDRAHNHRKLTVINKTSHKVLFSVDIKNAPDSQSWENKGHTGVVGHLPKTPKTFKVKAKIIKAPLPKFLEIRNVDPDKYKVKVYKTHDKYKIVKIRK